MPWSGLMYNFDGSVKTCIRSSAPIGNIKNNTILEILHGEKNTDNRQRMLNEQPASRCSPCYDLETNTNSFDIISDRVFYLKELKHIDKTLYDGVNNFELNTIDVRWTNLCNFACVYCRPSFSSKWASELNEHQEMPNEQKLEEFKKYIFEHASTLKHVYLAGGEPLLMKENYELLMLLKETNPDVNLRINTNLSKIENKNFDLICSFKNVHWIVSAETMDEEYNYIRHGGSWQEFLANLDIIQKLNHKISFNMLHFVLNYNSIFEFVRFMQSKGFHNNSFVIGPLYDPNYLNIRHLPDYMLHSVKTKLESWVNEKPGFLLENGLRNMLSYIQTPMEKNIDQTLAKIKELDNRRGLDSKKVFKQFYKELERQ